MHFPLLLKCFFHCFQIHVCPPPRVKTTKHGGIPTALTLILTRMWSTRAQMDGPCWSVRVSPIVNVGDLLYHQLKRTASILKKNSRDNFRILRILKSWTQSKNDDFWQKKSRKYFPKIPIKFLRKNFFLIWTQSH